MKYAKYTGKRKAIYFIRWYFRVRLHIHMSRLYYGDPFANNERMYGLENIINMGHSTVFDIMEEE